VWLLHCAELLAPLHLRLCDKVRATGHVFTDDTILPLQNSDPARNTTHKSRLWVYACHHRRQKPLVAYDFSRDRSQQAPREFLAGYRGYLQAVPFLATTCCTPMALSWKSPAGPTRAENSKKSQC